MEKEKILKEKILAGTAPKIEIKEEYQEAPTHPYQIVFNKDISKYMIDKANERKQMYKTETEQVKISFSEFEKIEWPKIFPYLMVEFLIQITDLPI